MSFFYRQIELIEENKSLKRIVEARVKKGYGSIIDTEKYMVVSRETIKGYENTISDLKMRNKLNKQDRFFHEKVKEIIEERDKLKETISKIQTKSANQFNDFSFQIHELKQKRDELRATRGILENKVKHLTMYNDNLEADKERLNNRVSELLEIEQEYKKECFEIASRDTTIKIRDNQLEHKQKTLVKQADKIMELNDTVKQVRDINDMLDSKNRSLIEYNKKLEDGNAYLKGEKIGYLKQIKELEKENTSMFKRIEILVDKQYKYQSNISALKNENFNLRTSKMDINKHLDTISALGGEIADNRVFINEIYTKLMNRDTVIDQYRERGWKVREAHNETVQALHTRYADTIAEKDDYIDTVRTVNERLKEGSNIATEIINELRDSLKEARDDRSQLINRNLIERILNK